MNKKLLAANAVLVVLVLGHEAWSQVKGTPPPPVPPGGTVPGAPPPPVPATLSTNATAPRPAFPAGPVPYLAFASVAPNGTPYLRPNAPDLRFTRNIAKLQHPQPGEYFVWLANAPPETVCTVSSNLNSSACTISGQGELYSVSCHETSSWTNHTDVPFSVTCMGAPR